MATTKIWAVHSKLERVIDYAENEQKTENPAWSEIDYQALRDVMEYAVNDAKTERQYYVTGLNCNPTCARDQMQMVKQQYGKEDGILAFHGYQSFKPGEVDAETAHEIGVKLAKELFFDYQVIVATHLDKAHLHNHLLLNSVSLSGRKFNATKASYRQMRAVSDRLCKEYGLSIITEHTAYYPKHYAEWTAEQQGQATWRSSIRVDMDDAIRESMTMTQFFSSMKKKGYIFERRGSFLRIRALGMKRFVRLRSLGKGYSETDVLDRILQQKYRFHSPVYARSKKVCRVCGDFRLSKVTWKGLRALYYFYLRKLHAASNRPYETIPDALRIELRNLDAISEQMTFLFRHRIDTIEQLNALKTDLAKQLSKIQTERKELATEKRRSNVTDDRRQKMQAQMQRLNAAVKAMRKDLKLCDKVEERSTQIVERQRVIEEHQNSAAFMKTWDVKKVQQAIANNKRNLF